MVFRKPTELCASQKRMAQLCVEAMDNMVSLS